MRNFFSGLGCGALFWYIVVLLSLGFGLGHLSSVGLVVAPLALLSGLVVWRRPGCLTALVLGNIGGILACILVPGFLAARYQGRIAQCKSNLKNLSVALEQCYNQDGQYPLTLEALTPPTCNAAGPGTYALGYFRRSDGLAYTLRCAGTGHINAHRGVADYPAYSSERGIIEMPSAAQTSK